MQYILTTGEVLDVGLYASETPSMVDLISLQTAGYTGFLGLPPVWPSLDWWCHLFHKKSGRLDRGRQGLLRHANQAVGPAVMLAVRDFVQSRILQVYLGSDVGFRVHQAGETRSGTATDGGDYVLRCMGVHNPVRRRVARGCINLLNDLFAIIVRHTRLRNGHVLKFLGDGMLVVFPRQDPTDAVRTPFNQH